MNVTSVIVINDLSFYIGLDSFLFVSSILNCPLIIYLVLFSIKKARKKIKAFERFSEKGNFEQKYILFIPKIAQKKHNSSLAAHVYNSCGHRNQKEMCSKNAKRKSDDVYPFSLSIKVTYMRTLINRVNGYFVNSLVFETPTPYFIPSVKKPW